MNADGMSEFVALLVLSLIRVHLRSSAVPVFCSALLVVSLNNGESDSDRCSRHSLNVTLNLAGLWKTLTPLAMVEVSAQFGTMAISRRQAIALAHRHPKGETPGASISAVWPAGSCSILRIFTPPSLVDLPVGGERCGF